MAPRLLKLLTMVAILSVNSYNREIKLALADTIKFYLNFIFYTRKNFFRIWGIFDGFPSCIVPFMASCGLFLLGSVPALDLVKQ